MAHQEATFRGRGLLIILWTVVVATAVPSACTANVRQTASAPKSIDPAAVTSCHTVQSIVDYNRAMAGIPIAAIDNPPPERVARYNEISRLRDAEGPSLEQSALLIRENSLREAARWIAQAI